MENLLCALSILLSIIVLAVIPCESSNPVSKVNATTGQNVTLPCSTKLSETVNWDSPSHGRKICYEGRIIPEYNYKYSVIPGVYDLIIHNVVKADAGLYRCIERRGLGSSNTIELIVTDPHIVTEVVQSDIVMPQTGDDDPRQKTRSDDIETSTKRMQNTSPADHARLLWITAIMFAGLLLY